MTEEDARNHEYRLRCFQHLTRQITDIDQIVENLKEPGTLKLAVDHQNYCPNIFMEPSNISPQPIRTGLIDLFEARKKQFMAERDAI